MLTYDNYGMEEIVDLKEGGRDIKVTQANKQEFVDLYVDWYLNKSIAPQFEPFHEGFYKVLSKESIRVNDYYQLFDCEEIIKLIRGVDNLDFNQLKSHARYVGCTTNDQHIKWFWEILEEFDEEQKKAFLMFTTGSDRSPLRGLGELNFTITSTGLDDERLPSAHTCFNDLILPKYSSKENMRIKILQAMENKEGFGLI